MNTRSELYREAKTKGWTTTWNNSTKANLQKYLDEKKSDEKKAEEKKAKEKKAKEKKQAELDYNKAMIKAERDNLSHRELYRRAKATGWYAPFKKSKKEDLKYWVYYYIGTLKA